MFGHSLRCAVLVGMIAPACSAQSLRQAADRDDLLIGAAVRPSQLSETAYASTLARDFNMVEAEDAMKWRTLRPDAAVYDFARAMSLSGSRRLMK